MKKILLLSIVATSSIFGIDEESIKVRYPNNRSIEFRGDVINSALEYINKLRKESQMTLYTTNEILNRSAQNHADYLYLNKSAGHYQSSSGTNFTGITPTDRAKFVGFNSSIGENVSVSSGNSEDEYASIDGLMSAIYHRFGFLDFSYDLMGIGYRVDKNSAYYVYNMGNSKLEALCSKESFSGYGSYITGACSDPNKKVEANAYLQAINSNKAANPKVVVFPVESLPVPPVFYEESPDPLPDYGVSGYPISIEFNNYYYKSVILNSFKLFDQNGVEITNTRLLSKNSDPHNKFSEYQFALFPLERLSFGQTYKAKVEATLDGVSFKKEWSFRTIEPDFAYYEAKNGDSLPIKSNKKYGIYLKPRNGNDYFSEYSISYRGYITILEKGFYDQNTLYITAREDQKNSQNQIKITFSNNVNVTLYFSDTDYAKTPNSSYSFQESSNSSLASLSQSSTSNEATTKSLMLKSGWNLIALPVDITLKSNDFSSFFGNYSAIYKYINSSWQQNPNVINKGEGFWIYSKESQKEVLFSGNSYEVNISSLPNGWHLLGSGQRISNPKATLGVNVVWKYKDGWFLNPDIIEAGEGFWIKK